MAPLCNIVQRGLSLHKLSQSKMKQCIIILLTIIYGISFGQNLIPNGDFEMGPDSTSQGWQLGTPCSTPVPLPGPNFWVVTSGSPDRMIEGDILCNWDIDTAQSGKAYIVEGKLSGIGEGGKAVLIVPLQKDSLYKLSYYLKLETFRGNNLQPNRISFNFNNGGNIIVSPYTNNSTVWQYHEITFISIANSSEIELLGIEPVYSASKIDNVFLIKLIGTGILNYKETKDIVNVYPNPSNGSFSFEYTIKQDDTGIIRIYDLTGKLVEEQQLISDKNQLQLNSTICNGIYLYQVIVNDSIIKSDKLVIIKQ